MIRLDSHVVVWLYAGQVERLSSRARALLEDHDAVISPIVELELTFLHEIERITASADQITMDRASQQKLIVDSSRKDFAKNSVVLVEAATDGAGLQSLQDLSSAAVKRIAVGKVATVPVGRYTKEVLGTAGLWSALEPKLVQADNVRQVLDYVSRGEAEAGFVYATDAAVMRERVKVVLTATGHTPVTYPVAIVQEGRQKELAEKFVSFLSSAPGREILARHGFANP